MSKAIPEDKKFRSFDPRGSTPCGWTSRASALENINCEGEIELSEEEETRALFHSKAWKVTDGGGVFRGWLEERFTTGSRRKA